MQLTIPDLLAVVTTASLSLAAPPPFINTHAGALHPLTARDKPATTVNIAFHDEQGHRATYQIPLDNTIYFLIGNPTAATVDKWVDFDNLWCGFGAVDPKKQVDPTWDPKDNVTHFDPPMVVGEMKCCRGTKEQCGA